ncbi:MAG: hypothetical protein WCI00_00960 [bacterium]
MLFDATFTAFASSSLFVAARFNLFIAAHMFSVLPPITVLISASFTHLSVNHFLMLSVVALEVISVVANPESIVVGGVHLSGDPYTYLFAIAVCSLFLSFIHLSGTHLRTL